MAILSQAEDSTLFIHAMMLAVGSRWRSLFTRDDEPPKQSNQVWQALL